MNIKSNVQRGTVMFAKLNRYTKSYTKSYHQILNFTKSNHYTQSYQSSYKDLFIINSLYWQNKLYHLTNFVQFHLVYSSLGMIMFFLFFSFLILSLISFYFFFFCFSSYSSISVVFIFCVTKGDIIIDNCISWPYLYNWCAQLHIV